jgi:hypothetical protein
MRIEAHGRTEFLSEGGVFLRRISSANQTSGFVLLNQCALFLF